MVRKVVLVGVGLIGASLGMALRRRRWARRVVGVGRTRRNLEVARARGAIDAWAETVEEAAGDADLVVVAAPVSLIPSLVVRASRAAPRGAVLTDAGSLKAPLVRSIEPRLAPDRFYVGSHPIAGTEDRGAASAFPDLFRDHRCVITPTGRTDPRALRLVRRMWEAVGMKVSTLPPDLHDRALAAVSHLPHVLAFALARSAGRAGPSALALAGPSFRDGTRVAASDPALWAEILQGNRRHVLDAVDRTVSELRTARRAIAGAPPTPLRRWLEGGGAVRLKAFPKRP